MSQFTEQNLSDAVARIRMMAYPPPAESCGVLMRELRRMMPSKEALDWTHGSTGGNAHPLAGYWRATRAPLHEVHPPGWNIRRVLAAGL